MNLKKLIPIIAGALCVMIFFLGLIMFIPALKLNVISGIIIAALSLAHGMLTCDVTSLIPLVLGILIAAVPNWFAAILFVLSGTAGVIVNLILGIVINRKATL